MSENNDNNGINKELAGIFEEFIEGKRTELNATVQGLPAGTRRYIESLERTAFVDGATGVLARDTFGPIIDRQLYRLGRGEVCGVCLVIADMDGLKRINDTHGHETGNEAIRHFASSLLSSVRTEPPGPPHGSRNARDFVCRYGGDEFGIVTGDSIDGNGSLVLVTGIPPRVMMHDNGADKSADYRLVASTGGAFTDKALKTDEFLRAADEAMYKVKSDRTGGRASALWTPEGGGRFGVYHWGTDGYLYDAGGKMVMASGRTGRTWIYNRSMDIEAPVA